MSGFLCTITEELAHFGGVPEYRMIVLMLSRPQEWFVFIDYLLNSHVYAVRCSSEFQEQTAVLWICGSEYRCIARTFSEFLAAYLADADSVLFPHDL